MSDFGSEHSAGRIVTRDFRAKFEQNDGKSVAQMMCITLVRKFENEIQNIFFDFLVLCNVYAFVSYSFFVRS